MRQILNLKKTSHFLILRKNNMSDFESKILQRVRFWVYCFCSLSRFHVVIKTGHVFEKF